MSMFLNILVSDVMQSKQLDDWVFHFSYGNVVVVHSYVVGFVLKYNLFTLLFKNMQYLIYLLNFHSKSTTVNQSIK